MQILACVYVCVHVGAQACKPGLDKRRIMAAEIIGEEARKVHRSIVYS